MFLQKKYKFMTKKDNLEKIVAPPSFIKLAMRNMVRKGSKSLIHFSMTFLILFGILILLAVLGKPNIPV
tara:strand:+ start:143 stop:349 length:207 start_codon:yes stop_codon:yes gene_type:complete